MAVERPRRPLLEIIVFHGFPIVFYVFGGFSRPPALPVEIPSPDMWKSNPPRGEGEGPPSPLAHHKTFSVDFVK